MKSLKKIAPIILIVIMALSWYNVLNGSVTNANAYKGYVSSAKKNLEENLPDNAVADVRAALEIKQSPEPVYMIAEYYSKKGDHDSCIDWCESNLDTFVTDGKLYGYLCKEYISLGKYSDCLDTLKRISKTDVYNKELKGYYNSIKYKFSEIGNRYDDISASLNGYCVVRRGTNYGICSVDGELTVKENYISVGGMSKTNDGLRCAVIDQNGLAWLVDATGTPKANISSNLKNVTNIKKIGLVSSGVVAVCDAAGKYSLISLSDYSVAASGYSYIGACSKGLIPVSQNGKWFFINAKGERVSDATYDDIKVDDYGLAFPGGIAFVKNNGVYTMIDSDEKALSDTTFVDVGVFYSDDAMASMCNNQKWGFTDKTGKTMFNEYAGTGSFKFGYGSFNSAGKWGFLNSDGKVVVNAEFDNTKGFVSETTAVVNYGSEWLMIKFNISSELE